MNNEKIIMYDSPEAATYKTGIEGWVSASGRFFGRFEESARYDGCTHSKCECGNLIKRGWTKCDECTHKAAAERFNKLPFREWDRKEPICTWDGDRYFFSEDDLISYMEDDGDDMMSEIDLIICQPNMWQQIDYDYWSDGFAENDDGDLPKELEDKMKEINEVIKRLPPQSYSPGKMRTKYKLQQ